VKNGWQQATLKDLCVVDWGNTDLTKAAYVESGEFLAVSAAGCDGRIGHKEHSKHTPVLSAIGAQCGKMFFPDEDFTAIKNTITLTPRDGKCSGRFLYYLLTFVELPQRGAGQPFISKGDIQSFSVTFPPLPEQQRIVGILDKAFEGIATAKANAEKNLQNARALFESYLQSVFTKRGEGWVEKRLEQIGTTQTGSTPKTSDRANYGDFIPFVKPADFNTDGSLDYENDGLSDKGLAEARKVTAGSVLMVCIGATIGKCGYCNRDITTNQQTNALTPFDGVSHKFVYYQMLTESFQRRVLLSSGQATLPIINKSKWSALTVALPPKLEDQKRIVAKFEALRAETQRLESIYQQKLAALEALKKSLLHQAFTGEL
jgi:type I restriction enzyme S subunit